MNNITPEKLAKLREAIAALQADGVKCVIPWMVSDIDHFYGHAEVSCASISIAKCEDELVAAYIAAADPQTVLALLDRLALLTSLEGKVTIGNFLDKCEEVERLRASNAKVTDARDNLLDEVARLQARVAELEARDAERQVGS